MSVVAASCNKVLPWVSVIGRVKRLNLVLFKVWKVETKADANYAS